MIKAKEIYDNKMQIAYREDFDNFIDIMKNNDPEINMSENFDRTMLVEFNNSNVKERFQETLCKSLKTWLESEITCPIQYIYNLMPLNNTQFILRI
jgi:hypothetical protein